MGTVHNTHLDLDEITILVVTTMTYWRVTSEFSWVKCQVGLRNLHVVPGAGKGSAAPHAAVAEDDCYLRAAGGQENGLEHLP